MQIIKLNYNRHDGPIVGAIALIPILVGVSIHSNLLLLIGLILFTLAGLEMMLRPSGSEPDYRTEFESLKYCKCCNRRL